MLTTLLLALMSDMVTGDECSPSSGYVVPTTYTELGLGCLQTGISGNEIVQINWSDGSYSILDANVTVRLAIGSCCSHCESAVCVNTLTGESDNQVCNQCQNTAGFTRVTVTVMMSIGTNSVGQWIECAGSVIALCSPPLTSKPNPITYLTVTYNFTDCNNCVESC